MTKTNASKCNNISTGGKPSCAPGLQNTCSRKLAQQTGAQLLLSGLSVRWGPRLSVLHTVVIRRPKQST